MKQSAYTLHALIIFLSAFLLFVVQPIAGKHFLPYFGGGSSVWATSLLFFTGMLFFGYLYVYVLTGLERKRQVVIHGAVILAAVFVVLFSLILWHSIYPPLQSTTLSGAPPALTVLLALLVSIGIPYFLLSTTGPLLQYWWGISSRKEPYGLYALSNAASFIALASYPFIIEPFIPLHRAEDIWAVAFFLYALMSVLIARRFLHSKFEERDDGHADEGTGSAPHTSRILAWILLAALPSTILVAVTSQITEVIAPVPLLWIVPLALYLLTMVIAFRGYGGSGFVALILLILGITYFESPTILQDVLFEVAAYLALLFFVGMLCHAKLYALRPKTSSLPLFYLFLSLGGMLGVLLVSIIAPLILTDFWEFPFGIALATMLSTWLIPKKWFLGLPHRHTVAVKIIITFFIAGLFVNFIKMDRLNPLRAGYTLISSSRNFYGVARIESAGDIRTLVHGATVHGMQYESANKKLLPTLYYAETSGVGRAIRYEQKHRKSAGLRVGVIGLGTATIASYCRDGDAYVFYEIDPRIVDIADRYFSYLASCKDQDVRVGDGRMRLSEELRTGMGGNYDVLVVDAFSDDSIPVHLLTLQALALYEAHLRGSESIIAFHTSNRYLALASVVMRLVAERGLNAMIVEDMGEGISDSPSQWVIVTKDVEVLRSATFAHTNSWIPATPGPLWTDDYSSLLPIVDLPL